MKKKLNLVLFAGLLVLFSCNKSGGGTPPPAVSPDEDPAPVLLSSNISVAQVTKAQGALDGWGQQDLYIYGLRRSDEGRYVIAQDAAKPYDPEDPNAYLIRNVKAEAPATGSAGAINVYRIAPADPAPGEYFFYRELYNYDFYGYFVDDSVKDAEYLSGGAPQPKESADKIDLRVKIDGTQDILLARTNKTADVEGKNVGVARAYSSYSARRGVKPNLVFQHQLSRFNFKVKAGNAAVGGKVEVKSLTIASICEGTLVIASNDGTALGLAPDTETPVAPLSVILPTAAADRKPQYGDGGEVVGSPILVMPGQKKYDVVLTFAQDGYTANGGTEQISMDIDFESGVVYKTDDGQTKDTAAVAGHSYNVTFIVYGLNQVDVEVTLTPWDGNHGEFELDQDNLG